MMFHWVQTCSIPFLAHNPLLCWSIVASRIPGLIFFLPISSILPCPPMFCYFSSICLSVFYSSYEVFLSFALDFNLSSSVLELSSICSFRVLEVSAIFSLKVLELSGNSCIFSSNNRDFSIICCWNSLVAVQKSAGVLQVFPTVC